MGVHPAATKFAFGKRAIFPQKLASFLQWSWDSHAVIKQAPVRSDLVYVSFCVEKDSES